MYQCFLFSCKDVRHEYQPLPRWEYRGRESNINLPRKKYFIFLFFRFCCCCCFLICLFVLSHQASNEEELYAWMVPLRVLVGSHNLVRTGAAGAMCYVDIARRVELVNWKNR